MKRGLLLAALAAGLASLGPQPEERRTVKPTPGAPNAKKLRNRKKKQCQQAKRSRK